MTAKAKRQMPTAKRRDIKKLQTFYKKILTQKLTNMYISYNLCK
nr:hypothetical protein [uncultured bacterium]